MGSNSSKSQESKPSENFKDENTTFVALNNDEDEYKTRAIAKLRKEYREQTEIFLLNQVLFSVMFFENYDKELAESMRHDTISVKSLRSDEHFLTSLKPDETLSLVNNHVRFSAKYGANKNKTGPLVTNRIFVIHENIQVLTVNDNTYSIIERPSLTAQVVYKDRKGYVQLSYIDQMTVKTSISSTSSSMTLSSQEENIETYGRITQARTTKAMPMPKHDPRRMKNTPYSIVHIKRKNEDAFYEDDEEYIHEYYVDSAAMMKQFRENWPKIAQLLELDETDYKTCYTFENIYCTSKSGDKNWEIIPAVQLPGAAYEVFCSRKQATNSNRINFPENKMLNEIKHMDRLAVPRGFFAKDTKEKNINFRVEWELANHKVEKYLQQQLTHTHVRILLFLLLIHKSYIEPETTNHGITMRHLVIQLFWELEKNVIIDETRMGTRLLEIIKSFCRRLGTGYLPDYFIEGRNHFENIPSPKLLYAQRKFSTTMDRPLKYFMAAIRNLKYENPAIPEFNVKELHNILMPPQPPPPPPSPQPKMDGSRKTIKMARAERARILREKAQEETKDQNKEAERKVSVDSIEESVLNIPTSDDFQRQEQKNKVLDFFINHFSTMAKRLGEFDNFTQAFSYLHQAELLTYLFHETFTDNATKKQDEIKELRKELEEREIKSKQNQNKETERGKPPCPRSLPERAQSIIIPNNRGFNTVRQMDVKKVLEYHQLNEGRKLVKKRRESEGYSEEPTSSESSDEDRRPTVRSAARRRTISERSVKNEHKEEIIEVKDTHNQPPKARKTVNFNSAVIIGTDTSANEQKKAGVLRQTNIPEAVDTQVVILHNNDQDQSSDVDTLASDSLSEEEDDLEGLDEIASDDDIIQSTNPFNPLNKNKINLGYEPDDTFT